MKKIIIGACLAIVAGKMNAQVGIGTATPDASAQLEIKSTSKGLLIPRVTHVNLVPSPATSLLVYQTMGPSGFYYYDGLSWQALAGENWKLGGNSGTSASHFIGTRDGNPLFFKVNNELSGQISISNAATALGYQTLLSNTGADNTAIGSLTMNSNTSGGSNTAIGSTSMAYNTLGFSNTAIGAYTMTLNQTGNYNTVVGADAFSLGTGDGNTAIGLAALASSGLATGSYNVATGYYAQYSNTSGSYNVANGYEALMNNTTGNNNVGIGYRASRSNSTGQFNIAIGSDALFNNINSQNNIAIGRSTLLSHNTNAVANNIAIGTSALQATTTGQHNIGIGESALLTNRTGSNNMAMGANADVTGVNLTKATAIGYNAKVAQSNSLILGGTGVDAVQVGIGNTAPNASAQLEITSDNKGLLIPRILEANRPASPARGLMIYQTDGVAGFYYYDGTSWRQLGAGGNSWNLDGNTGTTGSNYIGTTDNMPLRFKVNGITSGSISIADFNTSLGYQSLRFNTTGQGNTAFGYQSLNSNIDGAINTAFGISALALNQNGSANVAVGGNALLNNISGSLNVAIGRFALASSIAADNNVAVGDFALKLNVSGVRNVAVGTNTLNTNIGGFDNTAIGFGADVSADGLSNATAIGSGAIVNASNKVKIGNAAVTAIEGTDFVKTSDGRFKFNVSENVKGLSFILKLRPVTYQFDGKGLEQFSKPNQATFASHDPAMEKAFKDAALIRHTGLIAQEVEKAANETGYDFDGIHKPKTEKDHYSLSYSTFIVPLIKAVQEQQQTIEQLNKEVELLKQKEKTMAERLEQIEALLKK